MKWLITGGCGFIGRALILSLNDQHQVRVFDNLSVGTREDLAKTRPYIEYNNYSDVGNWDARLSLYVGDICDQDACNQVAKSADIIIHLAANTGVLPSIEDPATDCKTNVLGVLNMLEAARHAQVSRFVFASSGAPLGVQSPPLHEELAAHPMSPYGASKLAGEGYCSAYFHSFGIDTVALRFGNVYGEGSTHKSSVVAKFIKKTLAGDTLEIYGDGQQTRDFIHISDLVKAIQLASTTENIGGETFQIATASETTVLELTDKLRGVLERAGVTPPEVRHGPSVKGEIQRNYSDTTKAARVLGWQADVSLEQGLARTVAFFLG